MFEVKGVRDSLVLLPLFYNDWFSFDVSLEMRNMLGLLNLNSTNTRGPFCMSSFRGGSDSLEVSVKEASSTWLSQVTEQHHYCIFQVGCPWLLIGIYRGLVQQMQSKKNIHLL